MKQRYNNRKNFKKKLYVKRILTGILVLALLAGAGFGYLYWEETQKKEEDSYEFKPASINVTEETDDHRSYSVSSSSDIATNVGMSVLEAGGNAVDAAIAVAYTLGIVEPYASGLGGSGGMLVYDFNTDKCVFYDYRACAGKIGSSNDLVGVPGFVAGMETVHSDYGTISMDELIEPAVYYAENGFTVNESLAYRIDSASSALSGYSMMYNEEGDFLSAGDTMYSSEIASVLRSIQEEGSSVFYQGYIAEDIVANSSLTMEDLASYQVLKNEAVQGEFEGYKVYSAGMPLSGITLIQMLEMADEIEMADPDKDVNTYLSQLNKITSLAYSDRYYTISDRTFYDVDEQNLVSKDYIRNLLQMEVDVNTADDDESTETTSFSVVDSNGLAVSCTNTLSSFWGNKKSVDGIFLNNTNSNFSNSGINKYEPGKRSRTFTAPTVIVGEDGYVMAIGTPGGNNIPGLLFNVISDILKFHIDPQEAVTKPGILYKDGMLYVEVGQDGETRIDTSAISEDVIWRDTGYWWGSIALAGYSDAEGAFAAFDYRRGATMAGVYNPD